MPFDRKKYPPEWEEFSEAIRFKRAGGRCECRGECGIEHQADRCSRRNEEITPRGTRVVLTVAHLNHDTGVCRCDPRCAIPAHVLAMCQGCHLRLDRPRHRRNAFKNRRAGRAHRDLFDGES